MRKSHPNRRRALECCARAPSRGVRAADSASRLARGGDRRRAASLPRARTLDHAGSRQPAGHFMRSRPRCQPAGRLPVRVLGSAIGDGGEAQLQVSQASARTTQARVRFRLRVGRPLYDTGMQPGRRAAGKKGGGGGWVGRSVHPLESFLRDARPSRLGQPNVRAEVLRTGLSPSWRMPRLYTFRRAPPSLRVDTNHLRCAIPGCSRPDASQARWKSSTPPPFTRPGPRGHHTKMHSCLGCATGRRVSCGHEHYCTLRPWR